MSEVNGPSFRDYLRRVLPNGETIQQAISRLKKEGRSEALSLFERRIWDDEKKAGNSPDWTDCKEKAITIMAMDNEYVPPVNKSSGFIDKCHEGLRMKLPDRASIDKELAWVSANIHRDVPEIKNAPSYTAINLLIDVWKDDRVRATFWSTCLSKRLTPGDTKAKKEVVLKEDRLDDDSEDFADDLERRLAGQ